MIQDGYTCNFCGRSGFRLLFDAEDLNRKITAEQFSVCECTVCGLAATFPQPADPSRYYPAPYYKTGKKFDPAKNLLKNERVLAKLKLYVPAGRLLDVGCNIGSLARAASDSGYHASGNDISEEAVTYARDVLDIEAHLGDFIQYPFPDDAFDVITLSHVLEHTKDPKGTLEKACRCLKEGGILFLSFPDFGSPQARLFKKYWFHLDVPRHIYHFRREVVMSVLEETGFRIESVEQGPEQFDRSGFRGSMVNLFSGRFLRGLAKKIAPLMEYPFVACSRRNSYAASFEIIARKHNG